jgi:hypothetical protein
MNHRLLFKSLKISKLWPDLPFLDLVNQSVSPKSLEWFHLVQYKLCKSFLYSFLLKHTCFQKSVFLFKNNNSEYVLKNYIYNHFLTLGSARIVRLSKYSNVNTPLLNYSLIENIYFLITGGIPFSFIENYFNFNFYLKVLYLLKKFGQYSRTFHDNQSILHLF